jgi:hypothetical protein
LGFLSSKGSGRRFEPFDANDLGVHTNGERALAKPEGVGFCEALGFVGVEGVREGLLSGEPLPMFLAIGTVASLVEG